jgi:hypothetical protein
MVGRRERVIKARTNLVLSFAPMMPILLSKRSFTMFLVVRKRRRRSRITLMSTRAKTRMLLENRDIQAEAEKPEKEVSCQ